MDELLHPDEELVECPCCKRWVPLKMFRYSPAICDDCYLVELAKGTIEFIPVADTGDESDT